MSGTMSDKIKWTKQPVYPSLYTATIGGRDYTIVQKPAGGMRFASTTWSAWCSAQGAPQERIDVTHTLAAAKSACERHAKGAAT